MTEITSPPNEQKSPEIEQNPIQATNQNSHSFTKTSPRKKILIIIIVFVSILSLTAGLFYFYRLQNIKNRDNQRKADIASIKSALEKYSRETQEQKHYPSAITPTTLEKRNYIEKIPTDPKNVSPYLYTYRTTPSGCSIDCTGYTLTACLENKNDKGNNTTDPLAPCTTRSHIVSTP